MNAIAARGFLSVAARGLLSSGSPQAASVFSAAMAQFSFQLLRQDGVLAHFRGHHVRDGSTILMTLAASDMVAGEAAVLLNNEFALRDRLGAAWAVAPIASIWRHGSLALLYHDNAAEPLDQRQVRAVDVDSFLSLAISMAHAVRCAHEAGLIHKNIKPANILVDSAGVCRLAGFGITTPATGAAAVPADAAGLSVPRISGTLAYMSPEHTGRTHRPLDARSDLYSLGVTLYELLSGRLPFEVADNSPASEWIHAQLASEPVAADSIMPGVPAQLSLLVAKLLAKHPEQRYQSAAGLEADLKRCRLAWQATGEIAPFALGQRDQAAALVFPARLYGRDADLQRLLSAYKSVCARGTQAFAVISGSYGSGKSSLINSLLGHPGLQGAAIGYAKLERDRRDQPFGALADALRGLVLCVLGQNDTEVRLWQQRLRTAVGGQGARVLALVPELEMLIGAQAPADQPDEASAVIDTTTDCGPAASPRICAGTKAVLLCLLRAFALAERPLVLLLDDAHWLDLGSSALLEELMGAEAAWPLLLVISCRDSDVMPDQGFGSGLSLLRAPGARVTSVRLGMLDQAPLQRLLADTLLAGRRQMAPLAALVRDKTAGNPYYVRQFIQHIVDDGLLFRTSGRGKWRCQLDAIAERSATANVGDLLLQRLAGLPRRTLQLLGALAGLGERGETGMLCAIHGLSRLDLVALLAPALEADVLRLADGRYQFSHARVAESAYAGLSQRERQQLHLGAARLLAELADAREAASADKAGHDGERRAVSREASRDAPPDQRAERTSALFGAVAHLGKIPAATLLALLQPEERQHYAALCLRAARYSRVAGPAHPDGEALLLARALLCASEAPVQGCPMLAFEVTLEEASVAFQAGQLEAAGSLLDALLPVVAVDGGDHARLLRAKVWRLKTAIHMRAGAYAMAVATSLAGLAEFGVVLAAHPGPEAGAAAYAALLPRLKDNFATTMLALPPLREPDMAAVLGLLEVLAAPASFTDPELHFLVLCRVLALTLEHGVSGASAVSLAWFGVLLAQREGAYADGYAYARLAHQLVRRRGYAAHEAATLLALDQVSVWTQPLTFAIDSCHAANAAAAEQGDTTTACFVYCHLICNMLVRGDHLDTLAQEIARAQAFVATAAFPDVAEILQVQREFVAFWRNQPGTILPAMPPAGAAASHDGRETMPTLLFWRWLYLGVSLYQTGDYRDALSCLERAGSYAWSAPAHVHLIDYHLFSALTLGALGLAMQGRAHEHARGELRATLAQHGARIAGWAAANPASYADKDALVQAVLLRLDGDHLGALGCCERAIAQSQAQGYDHYAGLAHELAAELSHGCGHATAAAAYQRGARDVYQRWGALRKVDYLERVHPHLAPRQHSGSQNTVSLAASAEIRDIDSVIRSARALSEEIVVERLVHTLLKIALEHAGAQRGLLIRMHGNTPVIEASASTTPAGIVVLTGAAAGGIDDLPVSLLYTVIRTRRHVSVAEGARPAPFNADAYLQRHPGCAAICIPMLKQAQLVGLLYLENQLAPTPFSAEHAKVLELLAAQAAVSLETARLYAELVDENGQRRRIEKALRESKATLLLGEQISHSGSWTWAVGGGVMVCSAECCRIFGYDPEQPSVSFTTFLDTIHADDRELVRRHIQARVAERRTVRLEFRIARADGTLRYVAALGQPAAEELGSDTYVGTVTDITQRRTAEDTLRAAQADLARVARITTVGQLTASIAHEVNQPLMSIASNAGASLRWLEREPPRLDQVRSGLQDIATQSRRAGAMIQSLQALTRNAPPDLGPVDLHGTIRHILSLSRTEIERSGVSLELALHAPDGWVMGDTVQLQQVLLNMVINAIEAMAGNDGDTLRTLAISSATQAAGQITIRVEDTGMGLDAGAASHIFEAFYTTKPNGMGMGLAICRSIIESHRGTVQAEARAPRGSSFIFTLPLRQAA